MGEGVEHDTRHMMLAPNNDRRVRCFNEISAAAALLLIWLWARRKSEQQTNMIVRVSSRTTANYPQRYLTDPGVKW